MTRDDTNLTSLICPHCKLTIDIPHKPEEFEKVQLLFCKCPHCDTAITKEQIDKAYREYQSDDDE